MLFRGPYLTQAAWSRLAVDAGFGRIVFIERASDTKVAGYVTKGLPGYVTKDLADPVAFPRHFRRVRFSRGWAPGWVVRHQTSADEAEPWELVRVGRRRVLCAASVPVGPPDALRRVRQRLPR